MQLIPDHENVARAIFSPKMIHNGRLLPAAFELRPQISEEYISVMRTSIASWQDDLRRIPQRNNRKLYGFAEMNVGEIRHIKATVAKYDVYPCDNQIVKSHAGIFISINNEQLIGGRPLHSIKEKAAQDFLLLAIRQELVRLAQQRLQVIQVNP